MIGELLRILAAADLEPTPEELRDALWLAEHVAVETSSPSEHAPDFERVPAHDSAPELISSVESTRDSVPAKEWVEEDVEGELYAAGAGFDRARIRGVPVRSRPIPALTRSLELGRALRPIVRRVPSRNVFLMDESATVARIADEGVWLPVLQPAPDRWLNLTLVIDVSPSMVIWRQTVTEFRRLTESLGAFRRVRIVEIDGSANPVDVSFDDSGRQQAILVVTDAVGAAWRDGRLRDLLRQWGRTAPTGLVALLPQRMWAGSGLRVNPAKLHAATPGLSNKDWRCCQRSGVAPDVPIPVLNLSPQWLNSWAHLVSGGSGWRPAAVLADLPRLSARRPAHNSAAELVNRFRVAASPMAFQLACYFSAAWLNLPVMSLVQQLMLPTSQTAHLAEVFLGGLLRPAGPGEYDFAPGVRDELNNHLCRDDLLTVLSESTRFVAERYGLPFDFAAMLADPVRATPTTSDDTSQSLARVVASVLASLGGRYRALADRRSAAPERPALPSAIAQPEIDFGQLETVEIKDGSRTISVTSPDGQGHLTLIVADGSGPPRRHHVRLNLFADGPGKHRIVDGHLTITVEHPLERHGLLKVTIDDGSGRPTTYTLDFSESGHSSAAEDAEAQASPAAQSDVPTNGLSVDETPTERPPIPEAVPSRWFDAKGGTSRAPGHEAVQSWFEGGRRAEWESVHVIADRYELREAVGGKTSRVHRAYDSVLSRFVAVKLLPANEIGDPSNLIQFRVQMERAAILSHPAIVAIHDFGEQEVNGRAIPYLIMEYVDGKTLHQTIRLQGGRLDARDAITVMLGICSALESAHRKGIAHGAINMANVMITDVGTVKVLGFGRNRAVSPIGDIYWAGITLFEMLTGEPPPAVYTGWSISESKALDAVVRKTMAEEANYRYHKIAELRVELLRVLNHYAPDALLEELKNR